MTESSLSLEYGRVELLHQTGRDQSRYTGIYYPMTAHFQMPLSERSISVSNALLSPVINRLSTNTAFVTLGLD